MSRGAEDKLPAFILRLPAVSAMSNNEEIFAFVFIVSGKYGTISLAYRLFKCQDHAQRVREAITSDSLGERLQLEFYGGFHFGCSLIKITSCLFRRRSETRPHQV